MAFLCLGMQALGGAVLGTCRGTVLFGASFLLHLLVPLPAPVSVRMPYASEWVGGRTSALPSIQASASGFKVAAA